jgi:hypothetical protein
MGAQYCAGPIAAPLLVKRRQPFSAGTCKAWPIVRTVSADPFVRAVLQIIQNFPWEFLNSSDARRAQWVTCIHSTILLDRHLTKTGSLTRSVCSAANEREEITFHYLRAGTCTAISVFAPIKV